MLVCLQAVGNVYKQLATISSLMKVNPNAIFLYSYKEYHLLLKVCTEYLVLRYRFLKQIRFVFQEQILKTALKTNFTVHSNNLIL